MPLKLAKESDIILAIESVKKGIYPSARAAAKALGLDHRTVRRRMKGTPALEDNGANRKKLSPWELEVLIERILDMDARGFPCRVSDVADMANVLIDEDTRVDRDHVGKNWASRFIRDTPSIRTRISQPYDDERAKCEDPKTIGKWFEALLNTKKKYGILDEDTYNFDETGFMMGRIRPGMVVTATERRHRPKTRQPGNREWVTAIQAIGATGHVVPAYIIFGCKTIHLNWYQNRALPSGWKLDHTENGWTNNEKGLEWLKHFEEHTRHRTVGTWRLLLLDGHESHNSAKFDQFAKEHKIMCFYLPPHSSHLTQPLDVGCFAPLKTYYDMELSKRSRYGHVLIDKPEFLAAFLAAFPKAFSEKNVKGAFRGTGLVPWDPEKVLSQLDVCLRTPTPPVLDPVTWESQTPSNYREFDCQSELIRKRIQRHQSSSPTPMLEALETLKKGIMKSAKEASIMREENHQLRSANEELSGRKKRKKRLLKLEGPLSVAEGHGILDDAELYAQWEAEMAEDAGMEPANAKKRRRCGKCGTLGHNSRTCQYEAHEAEDHPAAETIPID